ncbi:hypothetical protein AUK22_01455 [bacterium CG2_30_54_10]|nr:MAG: hypothetical protein AUK22_01455 [bacterium CG2_30_54_10]
MKFKAVVDADGNVELRDGAVVLVDESGTESLFFGPDKINDLNRESATRRHELKDAKAALAKFDGLDADEMKELRAFKETHKDASSQIEAIKQQITASYTEKMTALSDSLSSKDAVIRKLAVSNLFAGSQYLREATLLPGDIAEAYFGQYFEVKDEGAVVAKINGVELMSRKSPGEMAGFDEAIQIIVETYPGRDKILKDAGHPGSGASTSGRFGAPAGGNPWRKESWNVTKQHQIMAENPALATRMLSESGA